MRSCKEYVEFKKQQLKSTIEKSKIKPILYVMQIDNNPASTSYIKGKMKDCKEVGIECELRKIPSQDYSQSQVCFALQVASDSPYINGILLQLPIPDKYNLKVLQNKIDPCKDVDGFRKDSYFAPCTPKGILDWLEYNHIDLEGKDVAVIGRSDIVGKPLTRMLINKGATVVCCNSHTKDIKTYTKHADIVITAIGKPKYFDASYFSNKTELIIDVGINRDENNKLCGDVDDENVLLAFPHIYITPVPGGVGLLTRVALLDNVVTAYQQHYLTSSYINKY